MDLRKHVGKPLKHHRVLEGGCYHKGFYYMCFGNMSKGTTIIVKFKAGKEKEIIKISKILNIGHANDCCVRDNNLYITHSGKSNAIHCIDINTLKKKEDVIVTGCKGGFNGISCMGTSYIVKKMSSKKCYILDKNFKKKQVMKLSSTRKVGQGITWHKGKLYRSSSIKQSKKNYVSVYNSKGKLLKIYHYDHKCELEDVMIVNDKLKISIYKKYNKKFQAYIKTLAEL